MNNYSDTARLLDETLAEAAPDDFRQELLGQTLRLARRRRYFRRTRRVVLSLALVTGVLLVSRLWFVPQAKPYVLVHTESLAQEKLVESHALPLRDVVATVPLKSTFATVDSGYRVLEIDDEDLLALMAPKPAVLIWHGPHNAELVLAQTSENRRN